MAFRKMLDYKAQYEVDTPVRKRKGPFILSPESLSRPEVVRHRIRLMERYTPPEKVKKLLLVPERHTRPFREQPGTSDPIDRLEKLRDVHFCSYSLNYGVIPHELCDVYPLYQTESSLAPTPLTVTLVRKSIADFIKKFGYSTCVIVGSDPWQQRMAARLRQDLKTRVRFRFLEEEELDKQAVGRIRRSLK
jgi:predicted RNA-binding protein